jgi:outer membrane receptor protein involved in Fe transport
MVTPIDSYGSSADHGFMSVYLRQPIHVTNKMPVGLDLTVNVTNLLAEGYRPFLSADGQTLFLASSPRTLQAGLSFTF